MRPSLAAAVIRKKARDAGFRVYQDVHQRRGKTHRYLRVKASSWDDKRQEFEEIVQFAKREFDKVRVYTPRIAGLTRVGRALSITLPKEAVYE